MNIEIYFKTPEIPYSGIGKTTVCKKVIFSLFEKDQFKNLVNGFYTEEVRNLENKRIGFDIIPLKNSEKRCALARIGDVLKPAELQKNKVGNYHVFTKNLDLVAVPTMQSNTQILVIDEIGKMELFSTNFERVIKEIFMQKTKKIPFVIATIPLENKVPQQYTAFFDQLRKDPASKVIQVNYNNRNKLSQEICDEIAQTFK